MAATLTVVDFYMEMFLSYKILHFCTMTFYKICQSNIDSTMGGTLVEEGSPGANVINSFCIIYST